MSKSHMNSFMAHFQQYYANPASGLLLVPAHLRFPEHAARIAAARDALERAEQETERFEMLHEIIKSAKPQLAQIHATCKMRYLQQQEKQAAIDDAVNKALLDRSVNQKHSLQRQLTEQAEESLEQKKKDVELQLRSEWAAKQKLLEDDLAAAQREANEKNDALALAKKELQARQEAEQARDMAVDTAEKEVQARRSAEKARDTALASADRELNARQTAQQVRDQAFKTAGQELLLRRTAEQALTEAEQARDTAISERNMAVADYNAARQSQTIADDGYKVANTNYLAEKEACKAAEEALQLMKENVKAAAEPPTELYALLKTLAETATGSPVDMLPADADTSIVDEWVELRTAESEAYIRSLNDKIAEFVSVASQARKVQMQTDARLWKVKNDLNIARTRLAYMTRLCNTALD
ncbi:hypothetical protein ACN47E_002806 [Coniothyrium glycines]